MTRLVPLEVAQGARVQDLLAALARALDGGPALLPYAADAQPPVLADDHRLPDGLALAVGTSGSTGTAKRALLTADNLLTSATATHEVLGGAGTWLLALPAVHIAGLQVLVRSLVAGTEPGVLDLAPGFTTEGFAAQTSALAARGSGPWYTALVPTQVARLLDSQLGVTALRQYDRVLVGGAATGTSTLDAARTAGVALVRTYGMSETAGGCVYDGVPLPVSQVHIDNDHHVVLGGSTVGHGYLTGEPDQDDAFSVDADGVRWFRTDDLGDFDGGGLLRITGRADDLVNTGGMKVAPGGVEDAILRYVPGVSEVVVVGTAHPRWGQAVSAAVVVVPGAPEPTVRDVRSALRGILPDHALPQRLLVLAALPLRGPGKPDRRAVVRVFNETLGADVGRTG